MTAEETRLRGRYATKRDGGLTYEYEGTYFKTDDLIVWRARVFREGIPRGTTYGRLSVDRALKGAAVQRDAVRAEITSAIEQLRED